VGFLLGQYAHANTHKEDISLLLKYLQKYHIFLNKIQHDLHHETFKQSFCILNGWANFLINPLASFMLKKRWLNIDNLELK
jgi:hypothetical protein